MGREYAHRRYGPNAHSSLIAFSFPGTTSFANSWYAGSERRSFDWTHIPSGYLPDLLDDNAYNNGNPRSLAESGGIRDTISNYSIPTIYNQMDGSTTSPTVLMNKLQNYLPSGNTEVNFNLLRNDYGY
ncbi:hypothetical protein [Niabella aquatica]